MDNEKVLAKVADYEITNTDFEIYLQKLPQEQRTRIRAIARAIIFFIFISS